MLNTIYCLYKYVFVPNVASTGNTAATAARKRAPLCKQATRGWVIVGFLPPLYGENNIVFSM